MIGDPEEAPTRSDEELVREVRGGNSEAFEGLVLRYVQTAHRLALSIVRDSDDADDVCQDGFVLALQRIDQLRDGERFRGWLLSIIRNRALNLRARQERFVAGDPEDLAGASPEGGPEEETEWRELNSEIRRAAEPLTETQRKVFLLHDLDGLDHGEIAETLGISRGASRVHLHMARRTVKRSLTWFHPEALR